MKKILRQLPRLKITVFWGVTPHNLPGKEKHFYKVTQHYSIKYSSADSCLGVKVLRFTDWLHPHSQGAADGLVKLKLKTRCAIVCCEYLHMCWALEEPTTHNRTPSYQFSFYQAISNTLKMGMESVPETLENFHTLIWPYGWENLLNSVAAKASRLILYTALHPQKQYSSQSPPLEPTFYI